MKKTVSVILVACALAGCENLNDAWKTTTDFVKGPIIVEAEENYLEKELYSSGSGHCLSTYMDYSSIAHYSVSSCPKNLSVPYIVKDISSIPLENIVDFGNVKPKNVAYNADTAKIFYLDLKPADDPLESNRIKAIFTENDLKKNAAPMGFVKKDGVANLKEKDAQRAKERKEQAEEAARQAKERAEKEKEAIVQKISQCRDAFEAAEKKSKEIGTEVTEIKGKVVDFAEDGVMVMKEGDLNIGLFFSGIIATNDQRVFIYTSDTDYATNERFKDGGYLYKRVGNYKYTTVQGGTNSVPAYKVTSYKKSEIDPKNYLADQSLKCCYFGEGQFGLDDPRGGCYTENGKKEGSYSYRTF